MEKDATTVLCCTSCSYAKGAVKADTIGRMDGADDGQMTLQGDAEVRERILCVCGNTHIPNMYAVVLDMYTCSI